MYLAGRILFTDLYIKFSIDTCFLTSYSGWRLFQQTLIRGDFLKFCGQIFSICLIVISSCYGVS